MRLVLLLCSLCTALHPPPARAERGAARGFMLQALVEGSVPLVSAPGGGAAPAGPRVRLGYSGGALAEALSLGYVGVIDPRGGARHELTAGIDLMPFLYHHEGGRARLYLLLGGNGGAILASASGEPAAPSATFGFVVGLGGQYFLHPAFALGIEIGARTQLWLDGTLGASSGLYGALSGTFVAGTPSHP